MTAYLISKRIAIVRQEGDFPAEIVITVPELINMDLYTGVVFNVYESTIEAALVFSKDLTNGVSVTDQVITVSLVEADTLGTSGRHNWECEISKAGEKITIGEGSFIVKSKLIE